jgi:signal transduction histidine kinase
MALKWLLRWDGHQPYEPIRSGGIRSELLRSHLTLTAIGVALLLIGLVSTLWVRASAFRLATVREPTARASMRALSGTQRSLAEMHGWVTLGDPTFKTGRKNAWLTEIRPGVEELQELSNFWPDWQDVDRLKEVARLLDDLEESQWWIEEVSQTPGNEPARLFLTRDIEPIAGSVVSAISAMIDEENQLVGMHQRKQLLATMADFQGAFAGSWGALRDFVGTGARESETAFRDGLRLATEKFQALQSQAYLLTEGPSDLLDSLEDEFPAYAPLCDRAIALRKTDEWDIAQHWLGTETAPLARQITNLLGNMATKQNTRASEEAAIVIRISNAAMGLSLLLIAAMAAAAPVLSVRRAARIADPIRRLAHATEALTARRLNEDIPLEGGLEIQQLTRSFNAMRTSIQQAEEALVRQAQELSRSNAELDDFAYIASHDLKEPLRGIHNYSNFLLEDYEDKLDDDGRQKLETLVRLTQRMEALIEALLYYSRVGRLDLAIRDTELGLVVNEVLDSLRPLIHDAGVEVRIPQPLPHMRCDQARVGEIFRNLVTNAIKYNDKPEKWVEINYRTDGAPQAPRVFYVRDNGIGIRENHLDSIFRIFKRLHGRDKYGGGTGAGLTIAKKIVERHGGRIWVESQVGEGTTFYFTLEGEHDDGSPDPAG